MVDDTGSPTGTGPAHPEPRREAPDALSRRLVREAWKATLCTLDRTSGHPYGSLVAVAVAADGTPLLLLSGLAEHSKNIAADGRASLLFDGTGLGRGALTGARVTLVGRTSDAVQPTDRARYLARHPDAAQFIDFGDFRLLRLDVAWGHMVAGFGRIVRLDGPSLVPAIGDAAEVVAAESSIIKHMNDDHAEALAVLAADELRHRGAGAASSNGWQLIGCDPFGLDLSDGVTSLRIAFPHRVAALEAVRKTLIVMVDDARRQLSR